MLSSAKTNIYIAMGGNLGDVLGAFRSALVEFEEQGLTILRISSAYQTVAHVAPEVRELPPPYWNAVIEVRTEHTPGQLLEILLKVEAQAGRLRSGHWKSRTLDLDLLAYGEQIIHETNLRVPHPRMCQRVFVLRPLAEIAADFLLASEGKTVGELLAALPSPNEGILSLHTSWQNDTPVSF